MFSFKKDVIIIIEQKATKYFVGYLHTVLIHFKCFFSRIKIKWDFLVSYLLRGMKEWIKFTFISLFNLPKRGSNRNLSLYDGYYFGISCDLDTSVKVRYANIIYANTSQHGVRLVIVFLSSVSLNAYYNNKNNIMFFES